MTAKRVTHDIYGRAYAKIKVVTAGDYVQADAGFTCIDPWEIRQVRKDALGNLYITCREGHHALSGQISCQHYIGLYPVALEKETADA